MADAIPIIPLAVSGDRKENFPDWPFWALAMIQVSGSVALTSASPPPPTFFSFKIVVADTPENRIALAKAPREIFIANVEIAKDPRAASFLKRNTIQTNPITGDSWASWRAALLNFAPAGAAEANTGITDTGNIPPKDDKDALQLLKDLKQARHDDLRSKQLARLKAFRNIGGHEVFPHIEPEAAEIVYTDSFPNLQGDRR